MLARFFPNGLFDASFGANGRQTITVSPSNDRVESVAVRPDGRIIAGGWRYNSSTGNYDWALVECQPDGSLQSTFGNGGIVTTDFGTNWDQANAMVKTASGIVLVGTVGNANVTGDFALARYEDTPLYSSISGNFFSDDNGDGIWQQSSEREFSNAFAYIDANNNGVFDTGETIGFGSSNSVFKFDNLLPGTYPIRVRIASTAQNYSVTTPPLNVTVGEAQDIAYAGPIGIYTVYNVNGSTFADFNGDGILDTNETILTGRTIYADLNDNGTLDTGEPSALSNTNGAWQIKLPKGTYRLRQIVPGGWKETGRSISYPISGSTFADDGMARIPTDLGLQAQSFRFGSQSIPAARVAGFVVRDTNGNGVRDTGEATLTPGDVVYIDANNNGSLDTGESSFTTNVDGWFFYLQPGAYTIRQQLPSGW
jgi:hypothetical protein